MTEEQLASRLLLLFVVSFLHLSMFAQQLGSGDLVLLQSADIIGNNADDIEDLVNIEQIGNNNEVDVILLQQATGSSQVVINQYGDNNLAEIEQTGGNNSLRLLQNGYDNRYILSLEGTNNDVSALQNGDQNEIIQRLTNSNYTTSEFIQNGDGNLIEHTGDGLLSKNITVLQSGNNMEVIINQTSSAVLPR